MSARTRILVADDEPNLRRVLGAMLQREGHDVVLVADGQEAVEQVDETVDVVITDLRMPRLGGMEVLRRVAARHPAIPVIIITAHGSVDNAVEALKAGAFDYIQKPYDKDQIWLTVAKAIKQAAANRQAPRSLQGVTGSGRFGLIGDSAEMNAIYDAIEKVADTKSTVLITGESGTGKELVAKALHEQSGRREKPFIKINCAAIPKNLMESEMFGYEKGAFTGAVGQKPGRFELADGGTLFLDEIGEIPPEMQVKLLRAIQESEFERVGGIKTLKVDVRLITATNRDLEKEVKEQKFREDLFYRLNVVPLQLPPLRERKSDIPLLVKHIIEKFNEEHGKSIEGISNEAMKLLCEWPWHGNIRELENVLERTILFCSESLIQASDLPLEQAGEVPRGDTGSDGAAVSESLTGDTSLKEIVRAKTSEVEKELIRQALEETGGNVTQAAKLLKISRKSLQMKMKDFGLRDRENGG